MKVLHTSDLHGRYQDLLEVLDTQDVDVWVDTGDFFPNKTRGQVPIEIPHQTKWALKWTKCAFRLAELLKRKNIPLISVSGNHDFVSLAAIIKRADSKVQAFDISSPEKAVSVKGLKFAGFREINFLEGEWAGELHTAGFKDLVNRTFDQDPDVLVTHSPPSGILDAVGRGHSDGIAYLTTLLTYRPHVLKAHLFGHVHEDGGKTVQEMGVLFSNAATARNGVLLEI